MAGRANRVAAIKVKVFLAFTRPDPRSLAALDGDAHLFVSGDLEFVFELSYVGELHHCSFGRIHSKAAYGFPPVNINPVVSSTPNIRFMFCTA